MSESKMGIYILVAMAIVFAVAFASGPGVLANQVTQQLEQVQRGQAPDAVAMVKG